MTLPSNPMADLQAAIHKGRAIIVSGTGVSIAASQGHPQASWTGLLESGLELLTKHHLINLQQVEAHKQLLRGGPDTTQFVATAQAITREMSPKMMRGWLKDTIGTIKAKDRQVLDPLEAMRQRNNLLATTNYDGLLLEGNHSLTPVTWHDKAAFLTTYRNRDHDRLLFLHGYWDAPDSVILDARSYQDITRAEEYRKELAAIWLTSTWLYVGCGESGLTDPDLGLLLNVYGKRARNHGHWDFFLALNNDVTRLQDFFNQQELNICVIGYGKKHTDLGPFLHSLLPPPPVAPPVAALAAGTPSALPKPPAFYASPDYIGRTKFIGRKAQLQILNDWAQPSNNTSVLLFEAIGGNGKSMLTWEWTTKHATTARGDWAGRFWYSFYEKGAVMRQFCQHALAYMTQQPLEAFEKKSTPEMREALVAKLHEKPWLLILDGLERVLVAYHRIDAAEVRDEDLNHPTDKILHRNPCDAIRDEDTDLLRALAGAAPSKILISSRLIPRALLNPSSLPLPGVKPIGLPGLDEADAEELLHSCGVRGASTNIRYYLKNYCGNHPLVIGVLAGLINSPGPHRGNFDAWAADPTYGAKLNLASLDLIQSRNHILRAALEALEPASRQLLSTLSLLSSAVDYATVAAFNPHLPPEPEKVEAPRSPEENWHWRGANDEEKGKLREQYEATLAKRKAYEQALLERHDSDAVREAPNKLNQTILDLEHRGLLQYDPRAQRYDLHPVVRGVSAGSLEAEDKERYGQKVVDHFNSLPYRPYEQAKTMADVENGLQVVRTLLKLGHHQQAAFYMSDLVHALLFNLEANVETLSLLHPMFRLGWDQLPQDMNAFYAASLANDAALALQGCGEDEQAIRAYTAALREGLERGDWINTLGRLVNISPSLSNQNRLAQGLRVSTLALELAIEREDKQAIFFTRLELFSFQSMLGFWQDATEAWHFLNSEGRTWDRNVYRQGDAEWYFARFQFWQGRLLEEHLTAADKLAMQDHNRMTLRHLYNLSGAWRLEQSKWPLAAESFTQAVTMAREVRLVDETSETGLALAKVHLGQLTNDEARTEAQRLAQLRNPAHRYLALLWEALGDLDQAKHHALAAYTWAWADGEPYVHRYELTKATELLNELGVPIPNLPPYDPTKDDPFPWEADVRVAIEKLRAEKAAKEKA